MTVDQWAMAFVAEDPVPVVWRSLGSLYVAGGLLGVASICGGLRPDAILTRFARILESMLRGADVAARVGGDEFVILAPDTDLAGALTLAERLRAATASELSMHARPQTTSWGVAMVPDQAADGDALLLAADRALYAAKDSGRNRVVAGSQPAGGAVHLR